MLICDLRELPKAITTTFLRKLLKGTGLIAHPNGKKVIDATMGNPQSVSKVAIARLRNISQRLPAEWLLDLASLDKVRR